MGRASHATLVWLAIAACVPRPEFAGITDAAPEGIATVPIDVLAFTRDRSGSHAENVLVVFVNPDGSVQTTARTNAAGMARGELVEGGTIYASFEAPNERFLVSIAGVEGGDVLQLGERALPAATQTTPVTLMFPDHPTAGAVYDAYTICGRTLNAAGFPMTLRRDDRCTGVYDLLVVASTTAGVPLGTHFVANVSLATTQVSRMNAWAGLGSLSIDVSGIPDAQAFSVNAANLSDGVILYDWPLGSFPVSGDGNSGTRSYQPNGDANHQIAVRLVSATAGMRPQRIKELVPASGVYNLTVPSEMRPPWITAPTTDRTTVTWTQMSGGSAQLFVLELSALRGSDTYTWRWIAPAPASSTFALPVLPAELADHAFQPSDTLTLRASYIRVDDPVTYDALRPIADLDAFPPNTVVEPLLALPGITRVIRTL
jgi:hypothetical protein